MNKENYKGLFRNIASMVELGLKCPHHGKEIVELIEREIKMSGCVPLTQIEINVGVNDSKLAAVKLYKERNCCSLMDAKRAVESYFELHGLTFKKYCVD